MDYDSIITLMRARETLASISRSLQMINEELPPEDVFSTGMLCSDLLALTDELLDEFMVLFPEECAELGDPPEFSRRPGPPEEVLDEMIAHFQQCERYFIDLGSLAWPAPEEQAEITDEDLWKFIADD